MSAKATKTPHFALPDRMYFEQELIQEHGLTDDTLVEARRAGVRPRLVGRRNAYLGSELIAYFASLPGKDFVPACR